MPDITDEYIRQQAAELGSVLTRASAMLVTAESCTGGWVAKAMTDQAGSFGLRHGWASYLQQPC